MPNVEGTRNIYFGKNEAPIVKGWTAKEIATLISKGRQLFEMAMSNAEDEEIEYLEANPELMEVIKKW